MNRTPQNERRMRSPLGVVSPNVPSNPASGAPKIGVPGQEQKEKKFFGIF